MGSDRRKILVAGATGALGRHVVDELKRRGFAVRALGRRGGGAGAVGADEVVFADALDAASLHVACAGVDAVFSCLGASVQPELRFGRASFGRVDWPANRNLVDAAKAAGAKRFVYVSVAGAPGARALDYMDAHERVVDHLRASGLAYTVLRPTGFFSAFALFTELARKGRVPVIGDGAARTNPIDERDLATACAEAIESERSEELDVGGPQVLARREIAELACRVQHAPVRLQRAPAALLRLLAWLARPLHPRIAAIVAFVEHVSTRDCVAPARGARTLEEFFRERVTPRAAPAALRSP